MPVNHKHRAHTLACACLGRLRANSPRSADALWTRRLHESGPELQNRTSAAAVRFLRRWGRGGRKLLGGRTRGLTAQLSWRRQIRRRTRIPEAWIHVRAKVCLPDLQSISRPGPGRRVCSSFASPSVCFPLHWSDHLLVPASTQVLPQFGGRRERRGGGWGRGATNTAGRPTHNAARQATEITKPLRLLRADVLNPPFLQPSPGD